MKRAICIVISFSLLMFSFCGCQEKGGSDHSSKEAKVNKITLSDLQADLNEQRKKQVSEPMKYNIEEYKNPKADLEDFSDEEVQELVKKHPYKSEITLDEALADVETLMKILKTSYGGYYYFGGDERFGQAKDRIIERVREKYGQAAASTGFLHNIMLEELAFIEDTHFLIGKKNTAYKEKMIFTDSKNRDFIKDESGYSTDIDGEACYVSSDDEKYLHLTVTDDGTLVYGLFALAEDKSSLPGEFTLKSKSGKESKLNVSWNTANAGNPADKRQVHSSSDKDGIPVSALGRMSISSTDLSKTNEFIDEAKDLRNKKTFILDLRGNMGGFVKINDFFLYNLTGSRCEPKMQTAKCYSALNRYHESVNYKAIGGENGLTEFPGINFYEENKDLVKSWYKDDIDGSKAGAGETVITDNNAKWNNYDNTIVVLIDKDTASAGEYILFQLATVENVIFMGTNSNGCIVTGDVNSLSDVYLPNSGIAVNYGQALAVTDKINGYDTDGWMPDIITRGDAVDAAAALINKK